MLQTEPDSPVAPEDLTLRLERDVDAFIADPVGRYMAGPSWIVFCHSLELRGHVVWGSPTTAEMREMVRALGLAARDWDGCTDWLVDLRDLSFIEPRSFGLMVEFVQQHRKRLQHTVRRMAQLRPPGMLGAIISGFSAIALAPYEEQVFSQADEAFDWFAFDRATGRRLLETLDGIRRAIASGGDVVGELRGMLLETPTLSIEDAARRLGNSTRQLQRRLTEKETTYRAQVRCAQLEIAKRLLSEGNHSVTEVAYEVGFSSAQHFSTAFREEIGVSPSDWCKTATTQIGAR